MRIIKTKAVAFCVLATILVLSVVGIIALASPQLASADDAVLFFENFDALTDGTEYGTVLGSNPRMKVVGGKLSTAGCENNTAASVFPLGDVSFTKDWSFAVTVNYPAEGDFWSNIQMVGLYGGSETTTFAADKGKEVYVINGADNSRPIENYDVSLPRATDVVVKIEKIGVLLFYKIGDMFSGNTIVGANCKPTSIALVCGWAASPLTFDNVNIVDNTVDETTDETLTFVEDFDDFANGQAYGVKHDCEQLLKVQDGKLSSIGADYSDGNQVRSLMRLEDMYFAGNFSLSTDIVIPAEGNTWLNVRLIGLFGSDEYTQISIDKATEVYVTLPNGTRIIENYGMNLPKGESIKLVFGKRNDILTLSLGDEVVGSAVCESISSPTAVAFGVNFSDGVVTFDNVSLVGYQKPFSRGVEIYSENFADLSGTYGTAGEYETFKVDNKQITAAGNTDNCAESILPAKLTENFVYNMDMIVPQGNIWAGIKVVGLFGGDEETKFEFSSVNDECYAVVFAGVNQYYNNNPNLGGKADVLTIRRNVRVPFTVEKAGDVVRFYIDNKMLVEATIFNTEMPSAIKLYSLHSEGAKYDNISISKIEYDAASENDVLYSEDFSSYSATYYGTVTAEGKKPFTVVNNNIMASDGENEVVLPIERLTEDFQISVDLKIPAFSGNGYSKICLKNLFGDGKTVFFQIQASPAYNGVMFMNEDYKELCSRYDTNNDSEFTIPRDQVFNVTVVKTGNTLLYKLDDKQLMKINLTRIGTVSCIESIGLGMLYCPGATIDNIVVFVPEAVSVVDTRVLPQGILVSDNFADHNEGDMFISSVSGYEYDGQGKLRTSSNNSKVKLADVTEAFTAYATFFKQTDANFAGIYVDNGSAATVARIIGNKAQIASLSGGQYTELASVSIDEAAVYKMKLLFDGNKYVLTINDKSCEYASATAITSVGLLSEGTWSIDDLLVGLNSRIGNVPTKVDWQVNGANEYLTNTFDGTVGEAVTSDAKERDGFVYNANGTKIVSPNSTFYHAAYWNLEQGLTDFAMSVEMTDLGVYGDDTMHTGGLSFRVGSDFARYD